MAAPSFAPWNVCGRRKPSCSPYQIILGEVPGHRVCPPWHTMLHHNYNTTGWPRNELLRHSEGAGFAFFIGHVKWLKPQSALMNRDTAGANGQPCLRDNTGR